MPLIFVGYAIPTRTSDDFAALTLLSNVLGRGESSRLNQALVKDSKVAAEAFAGIDGRAKGGMLQLGALPTQGNLEDQSSAPVSLSKARIL